ncbi:hypothetical protein [Streptomyces griseosporeus]|uniref:hypothetical protein n=1 Tax=Streptomyces griseosporeus TaxID=1910 RepID=UPI0037035877
MAAISVGSVEVDVVPNARGVRQRLQQQLIPAGEEVGDELGRVIGRLMTQHVADAIRRGVTTGGRTAVAPATRQGEATGGAFARSFRARVEAALRDLPDARIDADSSPAQREIASIRAQLRALTEVHIGVDIDAAEATARVERLQARLQRLSAQDVDVQVRTDVAAASAQLAEIQAMVNRLDGQSADVDVDTRSATANMSALTAAAIAFGPAIIPVLPVVAAGLGAVAAAAAAAGAGLGAFALAALPAFKQIGSVLQAQKAAQDAATAATYRGGQAAAQASARASQLASAQAAVASAERNGARQIARAQEQVSQARRAAAQEAAQASLRAQQAARAAEDAEDALADAQRAARRAQEDLTAARRTAVQELQDLNNRLADSVLSQRDAELALREATAQRDKVLKNANSTELDKERALLAYDQAVQRLKEQTTETARLKQETAAANKAGVDGSQTVRAAQERLAEAQGQVADKTQALKDAQAAQARTAQDNAQRLADAQQRISQAQRAVADAQVQAAEQAASAQRALQQAQQAGAGTVDQAAIAQAKYQAELAKLTPAARDTMNAYTNLKTAFSDWSRSLQPAVMPIFTRALDGMRRALPALTPFVLDAASAITTLQDKASEGFKSKWWTDFVADLQTSVKPAIIGFGVAFGNVFKGIVLVIDAFLPHMSTISDTMQRTTGRFSDWAAGLKGSPEFERFLSYSATMAPRIWDALQKIAGAFLSIGQAISPISSITLKVIGGIAEGVSLVADKAPWVVQGIYGIVVAMTAWRVATTLWAGAQVIANAAMIAFNIISAAGPWGWIAIAIAGVVLAVVVMYKKFDWFRAGVQVVWDALKKGASAVLSWVKQNWPWILGALAGPIGLAVVYIIKHWDDIKSGISTAWNWIKQYVLFPVRDFFTKTVPGWADTLKNKLVGAFDGARAGIKKAWDQVKEIAKIPVAFVVNTVYGKLRGVWNTVAKAFGAPQLPEYKFASGGVMPGYTPGRDVHRFVSPTGGALELSGGEAIMRPEFTRAVGSGFVHSMNAVARSRGAQGVKAALAPVFGGNPNAPTDRSLRYSGGGVLQSFKDGGIFGWIGKGLNKVAGVGSAAWNKIKEGASWLGETIEASARAGIKHVVDPLLKSFPGMDTGFGQMIRRVPTKIIDALFGYSKESDKRGAGGLGGPRIQAALKWAKTQAGKPYQWAGNGNPSWDCSGFMSAIESVIRGQKPHRRWATMAFSGKTAPPGWVYHGNSPFRVGITNAGVGHTAGTLGGVNVESRGGDGVVVGSRARSYKDKLFTSWYGFEPGKYDSGGYLQPGMNLAFNGTGRPEPVFTTSQANALMSSAKQGQQAMPVLPDKLRLVVRDHEFDAYVEGVSNGQVSARFDRMSMQISAGRKQ